MERDYLVGAIVLQERGRPLHKSGDPQLVHWRPAFCEVQRAPNAVLPGAVAVGRAFIVIRVELIDL